VAADLPLLGVSRTCKRVPDMDNISSAWSNEFSFLSSMALLFFVFPSFSFSSSLLQPSLGALLALDFRLLDLVLRLLDGVKLGESVSDGRSDSTGGRQLQKKQIRIIFI
jgi:hypothetical protein